MPASGQGAAGGAGVVVVTSWSSVGCRLRSYGFLRAWYGDVTVVLAIAVIVVPWRPLLSAVVRMVEPDSATQLRRCFEHDKVLVWLLARRKYWHTGALRPPLR